MPAARPTSCANRPRSKPGSDFTSRTQTGRASSQALPGRPMPGTNDSASVTRRNASSPGAAACQAGLHSSARPSEVRTQAWPIAHPVRSQTERSTSAIASSADSALGDRERQLVPERREALGRLAQPRLIIGERAEWGMSRVVFEGPVRHRVTLRGSV